MESFQFWQAPMLSNFGANEGEYHKVIFPTSVFYAMHVTFLEFIIVLQLFLVVLHSEVDFLKG